MPPLPLPLPHLPLPLPLLPTPPPLPLPLPPLSLSAGMYLEHIHTSNFQNEYIILKMGSPRTNLTSASFLIWLLRQHQPYTLQQQVTDCLLLMDFNNDPLQCHQIILFKALFQWHDATASSLLVPAFIFSNFNFFC